MTNMEIKLKHEGLDFNKTIFISTNFNFRLRNRNYFIKLPRYLIEKNNKILFLRSFVVVVH